METLYVVVVLLFYWTFLLKVEAVIVTAPTYTFIVV
jgi:hypothetical protein